MAYQIENGNDRPDPTYEKLDPCMEAQKALELSNNAHEIGNMKVGVAEKTLKGIPNVTPERTQAAETEIARVDRQADFEKGKHGDEAEEAMRPIAENLSAFTEEPVEPKIERPSELRQADSNMAGAPEEMIEQVAVGLDAYNSNAEGDNKVGPA